MAKHINDKKNYTLLVLILIGVIIIVFTLMIIIGNVLNNNSQKNDTQNNMNQEQENEEAQEDDDVLKVIIDSEEDEKTDKTEETEPENEQPNNEENSNKEANVNKNTSTTNEKSKYYIKINNKANVVTIYKQDNKGEYTIPVKAMICSIGTATPTSGVYKTSDKYTWRLLQGNVYGQYAIRITGHILFHSVPYTDKSKDTLEWWEYDKLGTKASLGCIRLTVEDAKWIYDNCEKGTQVEFYSDANPGPLGKPTAKKISSYSEDLKKWDPTDPDANNPWKNYKETENVTKTEDTTQTGSQIEENTQEQEKIPSEETEKTKEDTNEILPDNNTNIVNDEKTNTLERQNIK